MSSQDCVGPTSASTVGIARVAHAQRSLTYTLTELCSGSAVTSSAPRPSRAVGVDGCRSLTQPSRCSADTGSSRTSGASCSGRGTTTTSSSRTGARAARSEPLRQGVPGGGPSREGQGVHVPRPAPLLRNPSRQLRHRRRDRLKDRRPCDGGVHPCRSTSTPPKRRRPRLPDQSKRRLGARWGPFRSRVGNERVGRNAAHASRRDNVRPTLEPGAGGALPGDLW